MRLIGDLAATVTYSKDMAPLVSVDRFGIHDAMPIQKILDAVLISHKRLWQECLEVLFGQQLLMHIPLAAYISVEKPDSELVDQLQTHLRHPNPLCAPEKPSIKDHIGNRASANDPSG